MIVGVVITSSDGFGVTIRFLSTDKKLGLILNASRLDLSQRDL